MSPAPRVRAAVRPPAARKASGIRYLILDVDGVMTDGGLYYSASGQEMKRFHAHDGYGIVRAREAGLGVGIISGRSTPIVDARARVLGISDVYQGADDKVAAMREIQARHGYRDREFAYIADDLFDIPLEQLVWARRWNEVAPTAESLRRLGRALLANGKPEEAERVLRAGWGGIPWPPADLVSWMARHGKVRLSDRNNDGLHVRNLLDDFEANRALSGNHGVIVKGMDKRDRAFPAAAQGLFARFVVVRAMQNNVRAITARRGEFDGGRISRHYDHSRRVEQLPHERHGLRVIARRERHDPPSPLVGGQKEQPREGAARLESPDLLERLALEEQARPGPFVQRPRRDDGRPVDVRRDPLARGPDVRRGDREPFSRHRPLPSPPPPARGVRP